MSVAPCLDIRRSQAEAGVMDGETMFLAPPRRGRRTQAVQAKVWNIGRIVIMTSLRLRSSSPSAWMHASQLDTRLPWLSMTPLCRPVVPEV